MKMKVLLFVTTMLFLHCLSGTAQVTIGSDNLPVAGALLDLKEQSPNSLNATATKGLGLPRVNLKKLRPTTPAQLSASIGNTGDWDLEAHIGLTIYNSDPTCYPAGIYVWNGEKWILLGNSQVQVTDYESDVEALKLFYNSNPGNTLGWNLNGNPLQFAGVTWGLPDACGNRRVLLLNVAGKNITSDTGIGRLDKLETLGVQQNQLTTLNVTQNAKLKTLVCSFNQLTTIDLTKNAELEILTCAQNLITSLDLSQNPNLIQLGCGSNKLTTLDISKNLNLDKLDVVLNYFTQGALDALKASNGNYCNFTTRSVFPQYFYNTTTIDSSVNAPACP